ncbi:MAG: DUF2029 domain-containing protein, partial [Kiritimatiellaeota bacterium]|nr:DUF2029 domain-containing protein [Kiritimatiellota bacterium]
HEILRQTLEGGGMVWLGFGGGLLLLKNPDTRSKHSLTVICSAMLVILYANAVVVELGHLNLLAGALYLPFAWLDLERWWGAIILPVLNWGGLVWFFVMLVKTLKAYGFRSPIAHYAACFLLLVNAPVLWTLNRIQGDFFVIGLILLAYTMYTRNKLYSALALAGAIPLNPTAVFLAVPFFYARDWKWVARFLPAAIALSATVLCCLHFTGVKILDLVKGTYLTGGGGWMLAARALLLAGVLGGGDHSGKEKAWKNRKDAVGTVLNSLPPLLFAMVAAAPRTWEHLFVFLTLPFLLLLKKMQTAVEWALWGFAYVLVFLLPEPQLFSVSMFRMLGAFALFYVCMKTAKHNPTHWFSEVSEKFERLTIPRRPPQWRKG